MNAICSCFAAWSTWCTLWTVTSALVFILAALHFARKWLLRKFEWLKTFYVWIGVLAVLGGAWAFLFPLAINADFSKNGDGAALRQTLIYTTGGLLGVITLGETRHKNDQEHMRQVHAERRSRYAKAIEQLADEKAPIRLGGVYTLVKLVDDWLNDEKTLPSRDERRQEGQIIIDSLCAYIRSSFPLAERHDELTLSYEKYKQKCQDKNQEIHSPKRIPILKPKNTKATNTKQSREEFVHDKSLFQEEQEVRKTILSEIKNRLNGGKTKNKDGRYEIKPGTWSYFEYDLSNTVFFYDVNFNKVNFSGKNFSFSAAKFIQQADFSETTFHEVTDFSGAHFNKTAKFSEATFTQQADFSNTIFTQKAKFDSSTFKYISSFFRAIFGDDSEVIKISLSNNQESDFSNAYFYEKAEFSLAKFSVHTIFSKTIFHKGSKFRDTKLYTTSFNGTVFTGRAVFESTEFGRPATSGNINKFYTIMGITDFYDATFIEGAYFFHIFIGSGRKLDFSNTRFARGSKNKFIVYKDSCIIKTKEHRSPDETITTIPEGCIVFDPKTGEEIPHTPTPPNGSV